LSVNACIIDRIVVSLLCCAKRFHERQPMGGVSLKPLWAHVCSASQAGRGGAVGGRVGGGGGVAPHLVVVGSQVHRHPAALPEDVDWPHHRITSTT